MGLYVNPYRNWTWRCGSCHHHPTLAVSLLGLAGGEEAAANRKDTHVSNKNTAVRGSRSNALLMELFDAAIFGELLRSVQQHRVGGVAGVGSAAGVTCFKSTMYSHGPVRSPSPSPRGASGVGGHSDMCVPGGMAVLVGGRLVGGSPQLCKSLMDARGLL